MFKSTDRKIIPYQQFTKETRKLGVLMSTTISRTSYQNKNNEIYGKKTASYLTEGMKDLHKPMTDEEFDKSIQFDNDDLNLSDVLDSVPEFEGDLIYYEDDSDK